LDSNEIPKANQDWQRNGENLPRQAFSRQNGVGFLGGLAARKGRSINMGKIIRMTLEEAVALHEKKKNDPDTWPA
jgi:hypothetical protein